MLIAADAKKVLSVGDGKSESFDLLK